LTTTKLHIGLAEDALGSIVTSSMILAQHVPIRGSLTDLK
jgi:hypothetical protein